MADPMPTDSTFGDLIIEGARQHNLKNISLRIPHNQVTAITGVSAVMLAISLAPLGITTMIFQV